MLWHLLYIFRLSCHWFHLFFVGWVLAKAVVRVQPHGLHHGAGWRYGDNRSHECSGHQTWHDSPEGSCGAGLSGWCEGIYLYLQETCQIRCNKMIIFCHLLLTTYHCENLHETQGHEALCVYILGISFFVCFLVCSGSILYVSVPSYVICDV